jgi:FkbM family methyltransferase
LTTPFIERSHNPGCALSRHRIEFPEWGSGGDRTFLIARLFASGISPLAQSGNASKPSRWSAKKEREASHREGRDQMNVLQRFLRNPKLLRLAYSPKLVSALGALGLAETLRDYHYQSVVQADGIYRSSLFGIQAAFRVQNPRDLSRVESTLSTETHILEIVMRSLGPGDVFLDIGANVGVYTILSARTVGEAGRVVAFEPEIQHFNRLQENLILNGLRNARPFRVALGEKEGIGRLYVKGVPSPSLVAPEGHLEASAEYEPVEVVNGDEFWKVRGLPPPRVVKIDVQGFELPVLRGLRGLLSGPVTTLLVCEIHPWAGITVQDVRELVASMGFRHITTSPRRNQVHMFARKEPLIAHAA